MLTDEQTWTPHRTQNRDGSRPLAVPRISPRTSVASEVSLRRSGHHNFRVKIFDASPRGCKVEYIEKPQLDEKMFVKFDGIEPLGAYVCWIGAREVGLEFDRPIHPAVFELIVKRSQSSRTRSPLSGEKPHR